MHTTGNPAAVKAWNSQGEVAPVSIPTRTTFGAFARISSAKNVGSAAVLPSNTTAPLPSITQTLISLSDTSSPT
jgi:hypothetical protein